MAKRRKSGGTPIPEWVVTYGDMMSLLLCFFILLAAFSELKKPDEFRKVLEHIREALGFRGGMGQMDLPDTVANSTMSQLTEVVKRGADQRFMAQQNMQNIVGPEPKTSIVHDGNLHAIGGTMPFAAGLSDLSLDVKHKLREEVAPKIRDRTNIIRIVGHSWGIQDTTAGGHLDVSFARARAVRDYLVDECGINPAILRVVAAGDHEPMGGAGSDTGENRRVQVYMTDMTIDRVHPDPFGTGRGRP
jgi:chemotaxis protein MotB